MTTPPDIGVTTVLHELHAGQPDAQRQLLALIYDELRRMARGMMGGERQHHTWQSTELVHEVIPRLLGSAIKSQNRKQLFAAATRLMWEILVEHARARGAAKRGGGWQRVPLDDLVGYFEERHLDVVAVREALQRLAAVSEQQSEVISLRFFYGFKVEEIAELLSVSKSTVEKDLRLAKAWLHSQLAGDPS
jgi:RNA polymerase sigma factor (TIGR02999 family)